MEPPTTSVYRYFVKAAAPAYLTSSESPKYPDSEYQKYSESESSTSEYSVEKESLYVEGFKSEVKTSQHLSEDFEPPEDHPVLET